MRGDTRSLDFEALPLGLSKGGLGFRGRICPT